MLFTPVLPNSEFEAGRKLLLRLQGKAADVGLTNYRRVRRLLRDCLRKQRGCDPKT